MPAKIEHTVSRYDSQAEGMTIVSGWRVSAVVSGVTGRVIASGPVCVCGDEDDANTIAELLNLKYGDTPDPEVTRLREALERVYQTGRGPHVAIAREALDA